MKEDMIDSIIQHTMDVNKNKMLWVVKDMVNHVKIEAFKHIEPKDDFLFSLFKVSREQITKRFYKVCILGFGK